MSLNRLAYTILVLFVIVLDHELTSGRPAEPPTKFTFDTSAESIERIAQSSPTKWEQGMELLGRFGDALRIGRGKLVNSAMTTRNIIAERAESLASDARNNVASVIAAKNDIIAQGSSAINSLVSSSPFESSIPSKSRETVSLETENGQSILETKKSNPISNFLEMYLRPKPLVDKIREEEKYGNTGDKFIGVGRALVGGFEGLSNFFNAIVDFPIDSAKKTSRGFTEALNQLGGRLVGLQ